MRAFYNSSLAFIVLSFSICLSFSHAILARSSVLSTSCDLYIDSSPIARTTSSGEENVVNGNYQGVAQQYNSISGQVSSVVFWARVNPSSGNASNTLKVVIYNANLGLPGTILGSQNVSVDSASSCYQVTAVFSSPVTVSGSIIVSIEPFSPLSDNFFIQRNSPPDGQNLNLVKIKQANQWFKNLAAGDPAFDFDFLILPVKTAIVSASFTYNNTGNTTLFTNTSTNATSYDWDFGDANTSTSNSPSHSYASSGAYNVKLKAYTFGPSPCVDSITTSVSVVITGILESISDKKNRLIVLSNLVHNVLSIEASENTSIVVVDLFGRQIGKYDVDANRLQSINVETLQNGIYIINSVNARPVRFVKIN